MIPNFLSCCCCWGVLFVLSHAVKIFGRTTTIGEHRQNRFHVEGLRKLRCNLYVECPEAEAECFIGCQDDSRKAQRMAR
jgi:hypothetical protein